MIRNCLQPQGHVFKPESGKCFSQCARKALPQSIIGTILISCLLFQVKYKEKYEKEKGKAMLDFETPTYVTAKEAQHMQSQVKAPSASSDRRKACKCSTPTTPTLKSFTRLFCINLNYEASCYLQICFCVVSRLVLLDG